MLIFENKGLINTDAMLVSGVSAKEGDSPIGIFGTGLKYAIAIVLRMGGSVVIWRGRKSYEFATKRVRIRDQSFSIVTCNGRKTGFTTRLGLNWEPWMAYRELWSNTHDEGGTIQRASDPHPDIMKPRTGYTRIIVLSPELEKVHEERYKIVLQTQPLFVVPGVEVHAGISDHIYYRGIRVMQIPGERKSMYTYNLTGQHSLTEDRTLLHPILVPGTLLQGFVKATDLSFLHDILSTANESTYEGSLSFTSAQDHRPSPQFMEAAEALKSSHKLSQNVSQLFNHYQDSLPGYRSPFIVQPTLPEEEIIQEAISTLRRIGVSVLRDQLVFKSRLDLGKVQAGGERMTLAYSLIGSGERSLAMYILMGMAQMQGGSASEQLATRLITGSWVPRELTETYSEDADNFF